MVYGEPWAAAGSGLAQLMDKNTAAGTGVGAFNDHFRNALKGPPDGPEPAFVQDGSQRDGLRLGIMGSIDDWAKNPTDTIQYVTCHDNLTMWDKAKYSAPKATEAELVDMNKLAAGILAVSQGIMFLHAGHEIGYEKQMEHNSYNKPDSINSIKWGNKETRAPLFEYTKNMIALRRAHPLFRLTTAEEVRQRVKFHPDMEPSGKTIVYTIDGQGVAGEEWKTALVLINGEAKQTAFKLPEGEWTMQVFGSEFPKGSTKRTGTLALPARSLAVLNR